MLILCFLCCLLLIRPSFFCPRFFCLIFGLSVFVWFVSFVVNLVCLTIFSIIPSALPSRPATAAPVLVIEGEPIREWLLAFFDDSGLTAPRSRQGNRAV